VALQPGPADGDSSAPPSGAGPAAAGRSRAARSVALIAVLALGLCGLAASAAGIAGQLLPRRFTTSQQQQIMAWETAGRWRTLSAGHMFPAAVSYQLSGADLESAAGLTVSARRLGVIPQASCTAGADPAAARVLRQYGCRAVLRATYADSTGSLLVTVGVAVLPDSMDARRAADALSAPGPGGLLRSVRAAPVAGTVAAHFADRTRQLAWSSSVGSYVILSAAGFADGRPRLKISADAYVAVEMYRTAGGVTEAVSAELGKAPPVPRCPGAPGC